MNKLTLVKKSPVGRVRIIPLNEGHEIDYGEKFEGTYCAILNRSRELLKGLEELLTEGTWMVKIESLDASEFIYVTKENILDENFEALD